MATVSLSGITKRPEASLIGWLVANPILAAGIAAVVIPTMIYVATDSWSTDQGAHGPIVLATGLWLLWREWGLARPYFKPPATWPIVLAFIPILLLYFAARVSAIIELEAYLMYSLVLLVLYSFVGLRAMKVLWFPLVYMLFLFPPPDTVVAAITNPLKIALSTWAVGLLYHLGLPIASAGVTIQVGQYQLLVADACSGLNSLISLSAIALFYVYLRHHANVRYALLLFLMVLPVAVFANLVRIMLLVLLTYYGGESVAQGFLHEFAGMTMFMTALLSIFLLDHVIGLVLPGLKGSRPWAGLEREKPAEN